MTWPSVCVCGIQLGLVCVIVTQSGGLSLSPPLCNLQLPGDYMSQQASQTCRDLQIVKKYIKVYQKNTERLVQSAVTHSKPESPFCASLVSDWLVWATVVCADHVNPHSDSSIQFWHERGTATPVCVYRVYWWAFIRVVPPGWYYTILVHKNKTEC